MWTSCPRLATLPLIALLLSTAAPAPALAADVKLEAELGQSLIASKKQSRVYLRLSLKALAAAARRDRPPVNVAIVLDRSGSMQGDRLAAAKQAAELALDRLGPQDTVSLVAYNHDVDVMQKSQPLADRDALVAKIRSLKADGRTALHAGVVAGSQEVRKFLAETKVNRVVLMSDGLANVGPSTPKDLGELGRKLGADGISVSTIGLGLEYNEDLMQRLAGASDGNHAFVERPADLARIFKAEFGDALSIAAQDLEITIDCKLGFKPVRILGRDGAINGERITLKLNALQAENERYVVVELDAPSADRDGEAEIAAVTVDYLDLDTRARAKSSAAVRARFTGSDTEAEASLNKAVMGQVAEQIATETSEKAVELRDKGDVAGAKKVLEDNASFLGRAKERYTTGPGAAPAPTAKKLEDLEKNNRAAASGLDGEAWDKTRKGMRADQHKSKVQQSY